MTRFWRLIVFSAALFLFTPQTPAQISTGGDTSGMTVRDEIDSKMIPKQSVSSKKLSQDAGSDTLAENIPDTKDAKQKRLAASKKFIAQAWSEYQAGNYDRALDFFELARRSDDSEVRNEAELGLAYTLLKIERKKDALTLFDGLVQKRYRLENTVPDLMGLLVENQEWSKAKSIATGLPENLKNEWLLKLDRWEAEARSAKVRDSLPEGWRQLEAGDLALAKKTFQTASKDTDAEMKKQARLGLGYVAWKEGDIDEARTIFEHLFDRKYRTEETADNLLQILLAQKDLPAARKLLETLPAKEKDKWTEKFAGIELEQRSVETGRLLTLAWNRFNAGNLKKAEEIFESLSRESDRAVKNQAALGLGYTYLKSDRRKAALNIFEALVNQGYQVDETGPRLMDLLLAERDLRKVKYYQKSLPEKTVGQYRSKIRELELGLLVEKLTVLDPGTYAYRRTAEKILAIDPQNDGTRAALAWSCHKSRDYACALEQFTRLYNKSPGTEDYLLGLAYTLVELGEKDRALGMLENWVGFVSEKMLELLGQLYKEKAQQAYDDKEYSLAEHFLGKILNIEPENREMLELLAWTYYQQEKMDQALELFRRLYNESKSSSIAGNILMVLDKTGRETETHDFIAALALERERPDLLKKAGDYYFTQHQPIRAAQTYNGDDASYVNCHTPSMHTFFYYRFKEGDAGLSELSQLTLPLFFRYPIENGRSVALGVNIQRLDAGQSEGALYTGQYFNYIEDMKNLRNETIDSITVIEPMLGYKKEGFIEYRAWLGLTPLGGDIDPSVQFKFQANKINNWKFDLHQCSVKDTIQSYIGQKDPYSDQRWGRVLKTGFMAEKSLNLIPEYWMTVKLGYDYYWGENVVDNYSLDGSISIGRTFALNTGELSAGFFLTARHFNRNSDFYTFGHGGYFSPQYFFISGPFIRYLTSVGKDYSIDGSISTGYMQYRTHEHTPHYHLTQSDVSGLSPQAREDYLGVYEGEDKSGPAVNFNLKASKLINKYLAVGGDFGINTGSNHTQWHGGLALDIYFRQRKQLCPSDFDDISRECF